MYLFIYFIYFYSFLKVKLKYIYHIIPNILFENLRNSAKLFL